MIRSATGTALDVQWGVFQAGTRVWVWDFNGFTSQQWHADQL